MEQAYNSWMRHSKHKDYIQIMIPLIEVHFNIIKVLISLEYNKQG